MAPKKRASLPRDEPPSSSSRCVFPFISTRTISNGRIIDFNFLENEGFKIGNLLIAQGWLNILSTRKPIYPKLVYEFYNNIAFGDGNISSNVKDIKIFFDSNILGSILGVPSDGVLENNFPCDRDHRVATILGIEDDDTNVENLDTNMLSIENRLLHSIIAKIFVPRTGSFNSITDRDISIMYDILEEEPVCLPDIIMNVMKESVGRSKAALPYGLFLTYIFEFCNIKLKGETCVALRHSDIFNAHSLHRMDYAKRNGIWTKIRSRGSNKSEQQPISDLTPLDPPASFTQDLLNFDNPFLSILNEPNPLYVNPSDIPSSSNVNPNNPIPTVRLCDEQIQQIIREISSNQSSRSNSDTNSSVNDYTIVPHISSVFETLNQLSMTQAQLVHDVSVLKSQMVNHNETSVGNINTNVSLIQSKLDVLAAKAEWVTSQLRTNDSSTKEATNAFDHLNASTANMCNLVEEFIATISATVPDVSRSHPHLWMLTPQPPQPP